MNVKQSFIRRMLAFGLVLGVAACSKVPLSSLWALRGLQLAELDDAALRTLLYLPAGVELSGAGLAVQLTVARGHGHAEVRELSLALTPLQGAAATHAQAAPRAGGHWLVLGLSAAEQQRLAALRRELASWRSLDGPEAKRQLSLSAALHTCSRATPLPSAHAVPIDAWLRWKPGQADLRLLDGATLADLQPEGAGAAAATLPAC